MLECLRNNFILKAKPSNFKNKCDHDSFTQSLSIETVQNRNWFEDIPIFVKHKILKMMDHQSLIQFGTAFPHFRHLVTDPVYWRYLASQLKSDYFSFEEIKTILNHIGEKLRFVQLDLSGYQLEDYDKEYEVLFKLIKNVTTLEVNHLANNAPNISTMFCKHMNNLKYIKLRWDSCNSNHLIEIGNSCPYLNSIYVKTKQEINDGLKYLIDKINQFDIFNIQAPFIHDQ